MKNLYIAFFWLALAFVIVLFSLRVYADITKEEVVYDKDIVAEILPPNIEKEAIVAQVKHEELKWPNYTIRVGLGGARKPIPKIAGETVDERAKQWLDTAGLWYTLDTWKQHWETYKLDYALPICIAWADSHLWKATKSTNNIGNVWNNDRWDVVHYATLDAWIMAIYRTLNNKWIGGSTKLWQLSWEGRIMLKIEDCNWTKVNQKCYATSKVVWHSNVSNCLSAIHNKQIDENYEFRVSS